MKGSCCKVGLQAAHPEAQASELVVPGVPGAWQYPGGRHPYLPLPRGHLPTCGAGTRRTGPGPGSRIAACSDPATPDLSVPVRDLRTGIAAMPAPSCWYLPQQ